MEENSNYLDGNALCLDTPMDNKHTSSLTLNRKSSSLIAMSPLMSLEGYLLCSLFFRRSLRLLPKSPHQLELTGSDKDPEPDISEVVEALTDSIIDDLAEQLDYVTSSWSTRYYSSPYSLFHTILIFCFCSGFHLSFHSNF